MRKINKFKNFSSINLYTRKFPNKLSTFYRSKWQNLKTTLKSLTNNRKFVDPFIVKVPLHSLTRLNKNYQFRLDAKRALLSLFDNNFVKNIKLFNKSKKNLVNKFLILPLYRVDILLWYLHIFPSVYTSRQYINSGALKVNNIVVKPNFILKKGDIIFVCDSLSGKYDINYFSNIYFDNTLFLTFIEVDFYSKTITVIKDLDEITFDDYKLLVDQYINVYRINF